MKQLKASVPDYLQEELERAASASGSSLSEEIRRRLEFSFKAEGVGPEDRDLIVAISDLMRFVRIQTGHEWHQHAAAHRALRHAITARLARLKPEGEPVFGPGQLPTNQLVASDDPETMGLGLEAIHFHTPQMSLEQSHELFEKTRRKLQQREKDNKS